MRLNAKELRDLREEELSGQINQSERNPLYILLENVYDTYNVGGLFRLSDALRVQKLYLTGDMETPPNSRILKASIGTYKVVPWAYHQNAAAAIAELRELHPEGIRVMAVEQDARAVDYREVDYADREWCSRSGGEVRKRGAGSMPAPSAPGALSAEPGALPAAALASQAADPALPAARPRPICLILGNETYGVTKETLDLCDTIIEIPMWGVNKSLNVIVAGAVAGYRAVDWLV